MKGPCEHCPNPDKSLWTTRCMYKGSFPSRRAFVLSTFDPPCACDAYGEGRREIARRSRHDWYVIITIITAALALVWLYMVVLVRAYS